MPSLLERLALHRPELRAWAMYDWAASAMQTTIMVAVFPIYFITEAGARVSEPVANQYWAISNSVAVAIIALVSPVLGAVADFSAAKKRFLAGFTTLGVTAVAGLFFVQRGDLLLAAVLFVLRVVGRRRPFVFY